MFCARCHRQYDGEHRFCPYDGEKLSDSPIVASFPSRPTRMSGAVLGGRYAVRGFIGKGAMARVYLAEDLQTQQPVAVKVLSPGSRGRTHRERERFFREARAAASIGHPNIVKVLGVGQRRDGSPYIVMEFLYGESLGELLRREGTMAPDIAIPVLKQAAAGLAAAHENGVIHRDVKPDNVFLVGEPGDPYWVKILDFGLAKLQAQTGLTAAGIAVGTIEYMAPEQAVSDKAEPATDVYALGVVMYRMFTGRLPFQMKDDAELLAHHFLVPAPPAVAHAPALDPRIDAVVSRALRKRPENRYRTMDAMLEDLERLAGERDDPLFAKSEPVRYPDLYEPKGAFARSAAEFFYKRLGKEPPWGGAP